MNVNTLNNNNNVYDSVVLPPRMADIALWVSSDYTSFDATHCDAMYDRSGRGNHLVQSTAINKPKIGVTANQFAGRRVIKFTHDGGGAGRDDTYMLDVDTDMENVFGTAVEAITDPEFTIAMVINESSGSTGTQNIFSIEDNASPNNKVFVLRHTQGGGFRVNGDDATWDTSQIDYTQGTTVTNVSTLTDLGSSMEYHQWIAGVACDWDDAEIGVNYPCDPNTLFVSVTNYTTSIGATRTGSSEWLGEMGECLVWKGAHSAAERTETLNYLRDKWDCS